VTSKKRFGISIPINVVNQLEKVVISTGKDRSSIVTKALEEYLHEDLHGEIEHPCSGIIVYFGELALSGIKGEELRALVKSLCTVKLSGGYVTVLFVEGSFKHITLLRESLSKEAKKAELTRYIPLYCSYRR